MADLLTPSRRSENMRRIKGKNTKPEMAVRRLLHSLGYRYRLHVKDLPGKPDIVFPGRRRIIMVHGCFWHQHSGCREGKIPQSRRDYWMDKLGRNKQRDLDHMTALQRAGWEILVLWECQIQSSCNLEETLASFLTKR